MPKKKEHLNQTERIEQAISYTFQDKDLMWKALKHHSSAHSKFNPDEHNRKLAFLGEAVLELLAADRKFSIANTPTDFLALKVLGDVGKHLHLDEFIKLGGTTANNNLQGVSNKIMGEAVAAIFGAVYLDLNHDIDGVKQWFLKKLLTNLKINLTGTKAQKGYESSEQLGAAVLHLIATDYLYDRFPALKESDLAGIRVGCSEQMLQASKLDAEFLAQMYTNQEFSALRTNLINALN
jgi:dsRNA-specific ribonuclease